MLLVTMNLLREVLFIFICGKLSATQLKLSILPAGGNVIVEENDDLNLTCKVSYSGEKPASSELSWSLPVKQTNSANRVSYYKRHNELSITVHKLQEEDKGRYMCEVRNGDGIRRQKIDVRVNTGKEKCGHLFFNCGTHTQCVPYNYVCDGYQDCTSGADESFERCGADACEGKFLCNGRCISKKYCCDHTTDPNCTVNYFMPCCQRLVSAVLPVDILKMDGSDASAQYKYHNIGFYQSTLYTMISCAIAFVFMSTIMLIAVCRIRMRNAWYPCSSGGNQRRRFWHLFPPDSLRNNPTTSENRVTTTHAFPDPVNQSEVIDPLENFVLLTFDSNTGFEIAEYGPKPPPYTESNVGIPPPPYSSMINIASNVTDSNEDDGVDVNIDVTAESAENPPAIETTNEESNNC